MPGIKLKKMFSVKKSRRAVARSKYGESAAKAEKLKNPDDEPPFYIRGIKAASRDEYWVSLELERIEKKYGISWEYQKPVNGGREIAGGNVIDFLVHTPGMDTILEPMGRPWHSGVNEDRYQMEHVAQQMNAILWAWFTDETPSRELTAMKVREGLGV